jgi:hypothetical protein
MVEPHALDGWKTTRTRVTKKGCGMYVRFPHGYALVEGNIEGVFLDRVTVELGHGELSRSRLTILPISCLQRNSSERGRKKGTGAEGTNYISSSYHAKRVVSGNDMIADQHSQGCCVTLHYRGAALSANSSAAQGPDRLAITGHHLSHPRAIQT